MSKTQAPQYPNREHLAADQAARRRALANLEGIQAAIVGFVAGPIIQWLRAAEARAKGDDLDG